MDGSMDRSIWASFDRSIDSIIRLIQGLNADLDRSSIDHSRVVIDRSIDRSIDHSDRSIDRSIDRSRSIDPIDRSIDRSSIDRSRSRRSSRSSSINSINGLVVDAASSSSSRLVGRSRRCDLVDLRSRCDQLVSVSMRSITPVFSCCRRSLGHSRPARPRPRPRDRASASSVFSSRWALSSRPSTSTRRHFNSIPSSRLVSISMGLDRAIDAIVVRSFDRSIVRRRSISIDRSISIIQSVDRSRSIVITIGRSLHSTSFDRRRLVVQFIHSSLRCDLDLDLDRGRSIDRRSIDHRSSIDRSIDRSILDSIRSFDRRRQFNSISISSSSFNSISRSGSAGR